MAMFFVYILQSKKKSFQYVGLTSNLRRRISEHNDGHSPVTKFYRPLTLVWYGGFIDRQSAANFEHYLKSGSGRAFTKKRLVGLVDEVTR